jgi:hypothetical protein
MPTLTSSDTALVLIDPQNDVLSEHGAGWAAVGDSVRENRTVENMERLLQAAKRNGFEVFRHPEWGYGYTAALINFRFLAHAVLSTDEVVKAMRAAPGNGRR